MIRLSRKAWNNVIIFAMILMILLFNTTNNILTGSREESQLHLLPEHSMLMTLQMPEVNIERIGQGWRTVPTKAFDETQLQALAQKWQSSQMVDYSGALPAEMPVVVIAWLASENSGRVFQLYPNGQDTLVLYQQKMYQITDTSLEQLILSESR
ncbi:hypothetical protein [Aliiglaciecola sp. LCG003]|uniref:hypothetical protein n=1 Tax=Aliiglaciecola sp. LCG003 TaxID=3053655 RepID=UPI0025747BC1|nr:hypothetical protein [Aliiglaciecola sp. LCG003]WJG09507.1 hypothetical protein QR722_00280 [Aliiglaciecola sp. LCG003]